MPDRLFFRRGRQCGGGGRRRQGTRLNFPVRYGPGVATATEQIVPKPRGCCTHNSDQSPRAYALKENGPTETVGELVRKFYIDASPGHDLWEGPRRTPRKRPLQAARSYGRRFA